MAAGFRTKRLFAPHAIAVPVLLLVSSCSKGPANQPTASEAERQEFLSRPLMGKLAYLHGNTLVTYDFKTKERREFGLDREPSYPRWSPNGRFLLLRLRQNDRADAALRILDSESGNTVADIQGARTTYVCHWLDNERIVLLSHHGSPNSKVLKEPNAPRGEQGFYSVVDWKSPPKEAEWSPYYVPRCMSAGTLQLRPDGSADYSGDCPRPPNIACTSDYSLCSGPAVAPYMLPIPGAKRPLVIGTFVTGRGPTIQDYFFERPTMRGKMFLLGSGLKVDSNDGGYPAWASDGSKIVWDDWTAEARQALFIATGTSSANTVTRVLLEPRDKTSTGGPFPTPNESYRLPRISPDGRFVVSQHWVNKVTWVNILDLDSGESMDVFPGTYPDWTE